MMVGRLLAAPLVAVLLVACATGVDDHPRGGERAPIDHIVMLFPEAFDFDQPPRPPIALP